MSLGVGNGVNYATLHSATPAISNSTFPLAWRVLHLQVYLVLSASPHPTTPSGSLKVYSIPRLLLLSVPSGPALLCVGRSPKYHTTCSLAC